jgi:uncharacterized protein (TIGR00730 family)
MKRIAVFCGARTGHDPTYAEVARETARAIVGAGYGLVYGGGRVGLMGILADAALEAGGEVIGVIPDALAFAEVAHQGLSQLHVVTTMHERKALISDLSDAFIAIPGGIGTMDEFCEVLTWSQLGIQNKPVGLLNYNGFYDPLLALFDKMVDEGFLLPPTRASVLEAKTIGDLLSLVEL